MTKHTVIIAVTVQSYCNITLDAESEQEAQRIVQESINKDSFQSAFYQNAKDWDTDWDNAENLRLT